MSDAAPCIACGGPVAAACEATAPDGSARFRIVACPACGLARTEPRPSRAELGALYESDYQGGAAAKMIGPVERLRQAIARRRARSWARRLPPDARVLDVGCGDGKLVRALAGAGLRAVGLEGSHAAARRAGGVTGGRAFVGEPGHLPFADGTFDLVLVWHVLEHLPEPLATIAEAARCLKPGGELAVAVPGYGGLSARVGGGAWAGLDVPRHLHHLTRAALETLLARAGLEPVRRRHFNVEISPLCLYDTVLRRLALGRFTLIRLLPAPAARRTTGAVVSVLLAALLLAPVTLAALAASAVGRGSDVQIWSARPRAASTRR